MFVLKEENRAFAAGEKARPAADSGTGCFALFLLPFVLAGVVVLGLMVQEWTEYYHLTRFGETTTGSVVRKWVHHDSESGDSPYFEYRFEVEGRSYEGKDVVDWDHYERLDSGDALEVFYSTERPTINQAEGYFSLWDPVFVTFFAVFWNGFVGLFVYMLLNGWRLRASGRYIPGEVVSADSSVDSDKDYVLTITYRFQSPYTGRQVTGTFSGVCNHLRQQAPPTRGTQVGVLYLSDRNHTLL